MFNKKNKLGHLSINNKIVPEYREFSGLALTFAMRYCMKHREEIKNNDDVKKYFDEGLKVYQDNKNKKLNKDKEAL